MVISHAYTVFDANADATEVCGPSLVVGDIDTAMVISLRQRYIVGVGNERFDRNTIAGLQIISSGIARAVMHVKADVMTQVVWEKRRDRLSQSVECRKHRKEFPTFPERSKPSCFS